MDETAGTDERVVAPLTVRTTFDGILISLAEERIVSGGTTVYLSPLLRDRLDRWHQEPLPIVAEEAREALREQLVSELVETYDLTRDWAETYADWRLLFNRP